MFRTHNQLVPMRDAAILEELNLYSTQIVLRSALHATNMKQQTGIIIRKVII